MILSDSTLRRLLELAHADLVTAGQIDALAAGDPAFARLLSTASMPMSPREMVTLGLTARPVSDDLALLVELHELLGARWRADQQRIAELQCQAIRDPLTGVGSRSFLTAELQRAVSEARRYRQPVGLLFLDADRFKLANDTHGHRAGDELLRRLAETLANTVRQADVLARYGGDEFVILPSHATEAGLKILAERLLARVSAMAFAWNGHAVPLTLSIGGSLGVPHADDFTARLVDSADQAAFDAKRTGGNRYAFYAL